MKRTTFPDRIRALESIHKRFDAFRLEAKDCDVLFASYSAGSEIEPHSHETENWGVVIKGAIVIVCEGRERLYGSGEWYHVPRQALHSARCYVACETIEFWFAQPEPQARTQVA